jgi:hypothetical protein
MKIKINLEKLILLIEVEYNKIKNLKKIIIKYIFIIQFLSLRRRKKKIKRIKLLKK